MKDATVTDIVDNLCLFKCQTCDAIFHDGISFFRHLRIAKNHVDTSYIDLKNVLVKSSKHICRECGVAKLNDVFYFGIHLTLEHKMTKLEYCRKHQLEDYRADSHCKQDESRQSVLKKATLTDKLGNLCLFKCQTCGVIVKSWNALYQHARYSEDINDLASNLNLTKALVSSCKHICRECGREKMNDVTLFGLHLIYEHGMTQAEYRKKHKLEKKREDTHRAQNFSKKGELSSIIGNFCKFKCLVCHLTYTSFSSLRRHERSKKHGKTTLTNLNDNPSLIKIVSYQCKVCTMLVLCDNYSLVLHMRCHFGDNAISKYCKKFGLMKPKKHAATNYTVVSDTPRQILNVVGNKCTYKCTKCDKNFFEWAKLKLHLKKTNHGDGQVKDIGKLLFKTELHNCQICRSNVLCDSQFITSHLRNHKMTLPQYVDQYRLIRSSNTRKGLKYEVPYVKTEAERIATSYLEGQSSEGSFTLSDVDLKLWTACAKKEIKVEDDIKFENEVDLLRSNLPKLSN